MKVTKGRFNGTKFQAIYRQVACVRASPSLFPCSFIWEFCGTNKIKIAFARIEILNAFFCNNAQKQENWSVNVVASGGADDVTKCVSSMVDTMAHLSLKRNLPPFMAAGWFDSRLCRFFEGVTVWCGRNWIWRESIFGLHLLNSLLGWVYKYYSGWWAVVHGRYFHIILTLLAAN